LFPLNIDWAHKRDRTRTTSHTAVRAIRHTAVLYYLYQFTMVDGIEEALRIKVNTITITIIWVEASVNDIYHLYFFELFQINYVLPNSMHIVIFNIIEFSEFDFVSNIFSYHCVDIPIG
jgi:hypothetical protein